MPRDMTSRRQAIAGAAALAAAAPGAARAKGASSQPNLVLFFPDEMRADALGVYGNPVCKTPHFDRLAREGARFENCHVQYPVCGASRCSLLTGWPASVHGHRSLYYFLRPDEPNMFRYLRQAGYDVFWFGKNDALALATFADSVTSWRGGGEVSPALMAALKDGPVTPGAMSMLYPPFGDRRATADFELLQGAIRVLERREQDRPVCILLALQNPHPPYTAPADFYNLYKADDIEHLVRPGLAKKPSFHADIRAAYGLDKLGAADFRKVRAVYYGQVSYADWLLGELLGAIDRTGHSNDTAVFATSDHGDYAGDYGLVEKWPSGLEDCLTHVPLVVRIPGGDAGVVERGMTELYDVMASMIDLGGAKLTHTNFARTLVPRLRGGVGLPRDAAFTEGGYNTYEPQDFEPISGFDVYRPKTELQHTHPLDVSRCASVRTRSHRLIVRPQGQSELYDCDEDPGLQRNLIDDLDGAQTLNDLRSRLTSWYIETTGVAPMDKDPRGLPKSPAAGAAPPPVA